VAAAFAGHPARRTHAVKPFQALFPPGTPYV
jgi:hypothetical protein